MAKLLLDTNILIEATRQWVYTELSKEFPQHELVTTQAVVRELDQLIEGAKGEEKARFELAKQLFKKQALKIDTISIDYADDSLLELAGDGDGIVTHDKELMRRAKANNRLVVSLDRTGKIRRI